MGLTATLAARIAATRYEDLGEPALAAARRLVLDGIAVAVAGTHEDAIRILAAHQQALGGTPEATAIGFGFRTDPVRAAALNGAAMHVLDFEPMWSPATHALSTTLPVALALGEARGLAGREVLTALVKGIEIQGCLREASGQFIPEQLQFHPPGLVGPMGAAVAAAHLLELDGPRLQHALGIAGTFHKATFRPEELAKFGPPWRVVTPGYAIKMFPSQFGTHFVITAGLELHRRIGEAKLIRAVRLVAPQMPYINRPRPNTGLEGKFSVQYTLATALVHGFVNIDTFTDEAVHAPEIAQMLDKVSVQMVPEIPARFDRMHVEAEVELTDGRLVRTRCDGPRGMWGQPAISDEEHLVKVRDCLSKRLSPERMERCIALARSIDTLDAAGVSELMGIASLLV